MKEYIEREAARDLFEQALVDDWEIQYADDRLDEIPAADVVEVRHGRWIWGAQDFECGKSHECSVCGGFIDYYHGGADDYNYCPNCGAKMDGERKGGDE